MPRRPAPHRMRFLLPLAAAASAWASTPDAIDSFKAEIEPILDLYCYDCHGLGSSKGGVTLDEFAESDGPIDHGLWLKVLKNTRAGIMPPEDEGDLSADELAAIADWIKSKAFGIDPADPDPGRVTARRLNRVEYRNTVRDLVGVNFDTIDAFPPDDSGEGFDNIGDVLTISPMLLEKYLDAAHAIMQRALEPGETERPSALARLFAEPIPDAPSAQIEYASQFLRDFASRAFRRPVDPETVERLLAIAIDVSQGDGKSIEEGIGQAMTAILASPRFLFREEDSEPMLPGQRYPFIDQHALASRLSYFLWSSMPDEELFRQAEHGTLRANIVPQTRRMLYDPKAESFVKNFVGQWLHTRDVGSVAIHPRDINARDNYDPEQYAANQTYLRLRSIAAAQRTPEEEAAFREALAIVRSVKNPLPRLRTGMLQLMGQETELTFEYILRNDRSLLELIDSDYTFLNEALAGYYGIEGVFGKEMRRVELSPDSPRGGFLTQGAFLTTTSNPDRTSPVKRGVFILENILGLPPAPPPPDIPSLEEASEDQTRNLSLRESLALHREQPLCSSCHNRMDPLGLAFENFNAMGLWREAEMGLPIEPAGKLITGEAFTNVRELKRILATERQRDFFYCVSEKLLIYALGRGLEHYDIETIDRLAAALEANGGRPVPLILAIVQSAPFQKQRPPEGAGYLSLGDTAR